MFEESFEHGIFEWTILLHPQLQNYDEIYDKRTLIGQKIEVLFVEEFSSLEKFLEYGKEKNLEYLVVDDNTNRPEFLSEVYDNEEKYPYLEKIFDSEENGYDRFKAKLFKINYKIFDKIISNIEMNYENGL